MQNTVGNPATFAGCYKIAGRAVKIISLHGDVHDMCADYRCEESPCITAEISQDDIEYERAKSASERIREGLPPAEFPDSYLETLAVYRKICTEMLDFGIVLFHGSAVAVDGEGYLFTAKSGTGKSTHTWLWRELLGERAVMINDDKPLLEITDGGIVAHGTPWNGKHRIGSNISVPLKAICILERGAENRIERIGRREAYHTLLQQTYRPSDPARLALTLDLLDRLADGVSLYRLRCNMSIEAAETAYGAMKGG
jgi:hypothetical protein